MADEKTVDIIIRGRNLTPEAFAQAQQQLRNLGVEVETTSRKTKSGAADLGVFGQSWKQLTAGFTAANLITDAVYGLIGLGKAAIDSAGHLVDLRAKTGLSLDFLQRMGAVAKQSGSDVDQYSNVVYKMGINIAKGGTDTQRAVEKMGLSWSDFRKLRPEDQFLAIVDNINFTSNTQERNATITQIAGKAVGDAVAGMADNYRGLSADVATASDAQIESIDAASNAFDRFMSDLDTATKRGLGNYVVATKESVGQTRGFLDTLLGMIPGNINAMGSTMALTKEIENKSKVLRQNINLTADSSGATRDWGAELKAAEATVNKLTSSQVTEIETAKKADATTAELTERFGLSALELKLLEERTKAHEQAQTKATQATDAYSKKLQGLADTLTGKSLADTVRELGDAVALAGGTANVSAYQYTQLGKKLSDMQAQGASLTGEFADMARHHDLLNTKMPVTEANVAQLRLAFAATGTSVAINALEFQSLSGAWDTLISSDPYAILKRIPGALGPIETGLDDATKAAIKLREALQLANSLQDASDLIGAFADNIVSHFSKSGAAALNVASDVASIGASFAEGNWVQGAIKSMALLGQVIGKMGNETKKGREDFADSMGLTLDGLYKKLQTMGAEGQRLANTALNVIGKHDEAGNKAWMNEVSAFFDKHQQQIIDTAALTDQATISWQEAEAIMKEFGIEATNSGHALEQAKLAEQGDDIATKWRQLKLAGVDVRDITIGMADEAQAYIERARTMGLEVPQSMQAMLQSMVDMGQLTDANGVKMTDLSGIQFSTTPIDRLVTKLDELLSKLFGIGDTADDAKRRAQKAFDDLGNDATDLGSKIHRVFDNMEFEVPVRWNVGEWPEPGGGGEPGGTPQYRAAPFASGGLAYGPLLARIEPGRKEIIGDVSFMTTALTGALERLGRKGDAGGAYLGGGSSVIHVHNYIGDREIESTIIKVGQTALQGGRWQVPQDSISGRAK